MGRPKRVLQKAIAVIGEGYTEREYFDYVRVTRQFKFHFKPDLCKPSNYRDIFDKAKKLKEENYDLVFCVLDIDTIIRENKLEDFIAKSKELNQKNIITIASNPCIEFWFLLHFQANTNLKFYEDCNQLIKYLKKYIPNYSKSHKHRSEQTKFKTMESNEGLERALMNSKKILKNLNSNKKPTSSSFSEVSLVLNQLQRCKECNFKEDCDNCGSLIEAFFK